MKPLVCRICVAAAMLALAGCLGGPDVTDTTGPLAAPLKQIATETRNISNATRAIRLNVQDVEKTYPDAAGAIRANADSIDVSTSRLAAAAEEVAAKSAEYADQAKTITALQKKLADANDSATRRGRWIFYAGIMLGILGVAASVYAAIQSFSIKTLGAAVGSFVLAGISAGFLWYGNIIAIVLLALVGLFGLGVLVFLALKWRTLLAKNSLTFDEAEQAVGDGKILRDLKGAWLAAQKNAGIKDALDVVRGK